MTGRVLLTPPSLVLGQVVTRVLRPRTRSTFVLGQGVTLYVCGGKGGRGLLVTNNNNHCGVTMSVHE